MSWKDQQNGSRNPENRETLYYRGQDRDQGIDHYRSRGRHSRSGSRWESETSEDRKKLERNKPYHDDRYSFSERSPNGKIIGASGTEILYYKRQPPNNTIMIRGLPQHISENDIRQDIIQCGGLTPIDIRVIRSKNSGVSRGFAFVEFSTLAEAIRWMDLKQGVLVLQNQYRALMQYNIPKDISSGSEKSVTDKSLCDWFCIKCLYQNYQQRSNCYKCRASRMESEIGGSGSDEVCNYVTKTIIMRNLDALTTEDSVMEVLNTVIPDLMRKISSVCIGREPLTSLSRGICYLGTESILDSAAIYDALMNLLSPLNIDGKTVILSYCKYNNGDTISACSQMEEAAVPNAAVPSSYSIADVDGLAENYAKYRDDYLQYLEYSKYYSAQQISNGESVALHQVNQMDAANGAAAVAESAIQQMQASKSFYDDTRIAIPTGTDGKIYPVPDVSKYFFDKESGYQYDSTTGLYYDPNSTYYWNYVIQKFLYWDLEKHSYVLAPTYDDYSSQQQVAAYSNTNQEDESKKPKPENQGRVEVPKQIAKDMIRWEKTLNQKKNSLNARTSAEIGADRSESGFSVSEKETINSEITNNWNSPPSGATSYSLTAYSASDSSNEEEEVEIDILDFNKLICNLCKRQFKNAGLLHKHEKLSTLHKVNLEKRHHKIGNNVSQEKMII